MCLVLLKVLGMHLRTKQIPVFLELRPLTSLKLGPPMCLLGEFLPCFTQACQPGTQESL